MKVKNKTRRQMRRHNKNLNNAALYDFLSMLKYKCDWYHTEIVELSQYEPSTIICSNCGHRIDGLPVNKRKWICPECNTKHDRDINAAIVIEQKAREFLAS